MTRHEAVAEVVAEALRGDSQLTLDGLMGAAPKGFWESALDKVNELIGEPDRWAKKGAMIEFWRRNKKKIRPLIETRLSGQVVNDTNIVQADTIPIGDNTHNDTNVMKEGASPMIEQVTNVAKVVKEEQALEDDNLHNDDKVVQGEIPEALRGYLEDMEWRIVGRVRAAIEGDDGIEHRPSEDVPPQPPKDGKRMLGAKGHISVRVDARLVELFEAECAKYQGNASRAMDVILWRYFGKPKLSFEVEE